MKKFRRKALPALTMLVIAILCLTGVTYAWFTTGTKVEVKDIDVKVTTTSGGILVAANQTDTTYTSSFTFDSSSITLSPASTAGHRVHAQVSDADVKGDDKLAFFAGTIDNTLGNALSGATTSSSYIKIDVWFESLDANKKNVYFDYANEYELFGVTKAADVDLSAQSLRIAFVYQGTRPTKSNDTDWVDYESQETVYDKVTISSFASGTVYFVATSCSGQTEIDSAKTYYALDGTTYREVAEPKLANINSYFEIAANGADAYDGDKLYCTKRIVNLTDKPLTSNVVIIEPWDTVHTASGLGSGTSGAQSYYGLKSTFSVDPDDPETDLTDCVLKNSLPIKPTSVDDDSEEALIYEVVSTKKVMNCVSTATTGKTALFQLWQGYTHVTIYIWIEGQDIDCTNQIAQLASKLQLKFTAENVSE